jgi:hypothetical protein
MMKHQSNNDPTLNENKPINEIRGSGLNTTWQSKIKNNNRINQMRQQRRETLQPLH